MIRKIIDKYLDKKGLKVVNKKEYENMIKYRATRGELKRIIDDNNLLVDFIVTKATGEDLKRLLEQKHIEIQPHSTKDFLINEFINHFKKEFKKSEK